MRLRSSGLSSSRRRVQRAPMRSPSPDSSTAPKPSDWAKERKPMTWAGWANRCFICNTSAVPPAISRASSPYLSSSSSASSKDAGLWNSKSINSHLSNASCHLCPGFPVIAASPHNCRRPSHSRRPRHSCEGRNPATSAVASLPIVRSREFPVYAGISEGTPPYRHWQHRSPMRSQPLARPAVARSGGHRVEYSVIAGAAAEVAPSSNL